MFDWFSFNKYTALIVVLIFLIICYFVTVSKSKSLSKSSFKSRSKTKTKTKYKSNNSKLRNKNVDRKKSVEKYTEDDEEEEETGDDDINKDAEELYNLAHDGLCNSIKKEEFEELVGDLADNSIFIELKQLYNRCTQKGMDPNTSITIADYVEILESEHV